MKERVVQFGEGNFLRGFVDYFINELNEKANFDTSVVVVQPLPGGMAEQINAQSGVYTTILRGIENSELVEEIKKNTASVGVSTLTIGSANFLRWRAVRSCNL